MHTKLLSGSYNCILQSETDTSVCPFCKKEDEIMEHFLLRFECLGSIRTPILDDILNIYEDQDMDNSFHSLQYIVDHTVIFQDADASEIKF